jgi:bifunctional DNase/RNase
MLIQMEAASFGVDAEKNSPVIILKESGGERTIGVPLSPDEAHMIAINSLERQGQKPYIVDLLKLILQELGGELDKGEIFDYVKEAFRARIHIHHGGGICIFECRAADAIALAMRCERPLFVQDDLFDKLGNDDSLSEGERLRRTIANVNTIDFGRYQLG